MLPDFPKPKKLIRKMFMTHLEARVRQYSEIPIDDNQVKIVYEGNDLLINYPDNKSHKSEMKKISGENTVESAIPCFLALHWFLVLYGGGKSSNIPKLAFHSILAAITTDDNLYPNPYCGIEKSIAFAFEENTREKDQEMLDKASYYLWPILLLLARNGEKNYLQQHWPEITKVSFKEFKSNNYLDIYKWRTQDGENITNQPNIPESWGNLVKQCQVPENPLLPKILKQHLWFYPLFLLVFPHRVSSNSILFFTNEAMSS